MLPRTPRQALKIIAKVNFRDFDKMDWEAFAGAEGDNPQIGEYGDDMVVVIDDFCVGFYLVDWSDFSEFHLEQL